MSFSEYSATIAEGDTVILYITFHKMYPVVATREKAAKKDKQKSVDNVYQTSFGALKAQDLIGMRWGSKVQLSRGYAYALHPTPELWSRLLPHRTQILYATDISLILLQLELRPGSVVVESGTGSGSLTHSLLRTVAPTGHVHTFDFHEQRVATAKQEFQDHKVSHLVTCRQRDVCADGFDLTDAADAVFLDLPHPWEAIPHARRALRVRQGGRICSFSPCIEQVQKACEALRKEGFKEINTMECLLREFQVRRITQQVFDMDRLPEDPNRKRKADQMDADADKDADKDADVRADKDADTKAKAEAKHDDAKKAAENARDPDTSFVTAMPLIKMPGHTGYLTFATLPPKMD